MKRYRLPTVVLSDLALQQNQQFNILLPLLIRLVLQVLDVSGTAVVNHVPEAMPRQRMKAIPN